MHSFSVQPSESGIGYTATTDQGPNRWTHDLVLFHRPTFMEATHAMLSWFVERGLIKA